MLSIQIIWEKINHWYEKMKNKHEEKKDKEKELVAYGKQYKGSCS